MDDEFDFDKVIEKKMQQSSVKKSGKMKKRKRSKEEEQEEVLKTVACRWMRCKRMFEDDNKLYDHIALVRHVGKMTSFPFLIYEGLETSNQGAKYFWSVQDHGEMVGKRAMQKEQELQQQQKRGELRRKHSNDTNGGKGTAEAFRCRWRKCEMHAWRGDAQKKVGI